ncbi:hypothetical protein METSCH_A00490 [Metschnikowia aff. pulcherrima]|uniref:Uncharacterized protein n=1 Tax=Metschnikowia aff. pulcherrima TaxID=2163413 RepID=A0A4P6XIJ0_9ASCO|nr:hypothetical protein METSCH_A00490 [Metschnikowia aff. pulcherrima]
MLCSSNAAEHYALNLTPPPTPQNSNKRSRDDYEVLQTTTKKTQFCQIHSQAHLETVHMMMEASKLQTHNTSAADLCPAGVSDNNEQISTPIQRPFWPVITRLKDS